MPAVHEGKFEVVYILKGWVGGWSGVMVAVLLAVAAKLTGGGADGVSGGGIRGGGIGLP